MPSGIPLSSSNLFFLPRPISIDPYLKEPTPVGLSPVSIYKTKPGNTRAELEIAG